MSELTGPSEDLNDDDLSNNPEDFSPEDFSDEVQRLAEQMKPVELQLLERVGPEPGTRAEHGLKDDQGRDEFASTYFGDLVERGVLERTRRAVYRRTELGTQVLACVRTSDRPLPARIERVQQSTLDTSQLVLFKRGQPVDLNQHPSLLAGLHATSRALVSIDEEIRELQQEMAEQTERAEMMEDLGMSTKGPNTAITRCQTKIDHLQKRRSAHEAFYIEFPDLGGAELDVAGTDVTEWFASGRRYTRAQDLANDVPMDVLRALKHARDQGIFDQFRLYHPGMAQGRSTYQGDPVIVGQAGDAVFYIASWR